MTSNRLSQRAARRRGEFHRADGDRQVAQRIAPRPRLAGRGTPSLRGEPYEARKSAH
jgi:hypothetical protein